MPRNKTKIVLDADILIHFMKGDCLSILFDIFPEYEYVVLDIVYNELNKNGQTMINNFSHTLKKVSVITFDCTGEALRDYFCLTKTMGKGESACMVYCKNHKDVLGSSNLKDIADFCETHGITYLTTLDFLYYAYSRKKMTLDECNDFIKKVKASGSKLPAHITNIMTFVCRVKI